MQFIIKYLLVYILFFVLNMNDVIAAPSNNRYWQILSKVTSDHEAATEVEFGTDSLIHWTSSPVSWRWNATDADSTNGADFPSDVAGDAIDAAFDQWQNVSTATISFSRGTSTSSTYADDNTNILFWESDRGELNTLGLSGGGIAVTIVTNKTGASNEYKDVDICFNAGDFRWTVTEGDIDEYSTPPVVDIQSIAVHEIGHLLGIGHSTNPYTPAPVMKQGYPWDFSRHSLHHGDDKFAVSYIYGGNIIATIGISNNKYFDWDITIKSSGTINSNATMHFDTGVELTIEGDLHVTASGATFKKKSGASRWNGIDVKNGGSFDVDGDVTIQDATTGLKLSGGTLSNGTNKVTIQDCSSWGVHVYDSTPTVKYVHLDNTHGFGVFGSSANPIIENVTIHNGDWGLYLSNTSAYMVKSNVTCYNEYDSVFLLNTNADVMLENASNMGNNNIHPESGEYAIGRSSNSAYIDADNNWWGVADPPTSLFDDYTNVDYSDVLSDSVTTSGAGKLAPDYDNSTLVQAWECEESGDYSTAFELYGQLLKDAKLNQYRRRYIKNMLRVTRKSGNMFSDLAAVIENEYGSASPGYVAFLDYILCTLPLMEGDAGEAVTRLESTVGDYAGTPMEQEMLCKLASIYAGQLNDKQSAMVYADKAASLNPGNPLLDIAYDSCGIAYNASDYIDTSLGYQYAEKPVSEITESHEPSVSINPNPANPTTTITYSIAEPSHVKLVIYSVSGQKVATLVDSHMTAGKHSAVFDGSSLASGVYFYSFESKGFTKTGKMLLIK